MTAKRKLAPKLAPKSATRKAKSSKKFRAVSRVAPRAAIAAKPAQPAQRKKRFTKEELILEHRGNARKISRSIMRRWRARLELEELDSLVDLALCEAAEKYDPKKGASFMTFMFYHLRGCLVRAVDTAANANMISAADYEIEGLVASLVGPNDTQETSLVAGADTLHELTNEEYRTPEESFYRDEIIRISNEACARLDDLAREVIFRLYVEEQHLVDVAKELGYSRCHISRVKRQALDVLHGFLSPRLEKTGKPLSEADEERIMANACKEFNRRKFEVAGAASEHGFQAEVLEAH
jgi:RNA polymerase sigma factor for flagellar operon FliA